VHVDEAGLPAGGQITEQERVTGPGERGDGRRLRDGIRLLDDGLVITMLAERP
jgi:hypothetical protein